MTLWRLPLRSLLVLWLFLFSAVAYMDRTNISIAGGTIRDELHTDNIHLGWIFSAFLVGYAAFQIIGGWLACQFGPRRALAAGVLWWGLFTALTAIVSPRIAYALPLLILIRFSLGAGEAVMYPAANQFVAQWIPVAERGRATGWIFAGVGAGAGVSIPVLAWLNARYSWRASFWFSACIGLAVGLVWFVIARDRPEDHPLVSPDELALIQATRSPVTRHSAAPQSWRRSLINRNVATLTLSYFCFSYVAWIFFSWFFIYLIQAHGINLKTSAFFSMLPFLAMTVCCLSGGVFGDWLSHRWSRRAGRCGVAAFAFVLTAIFLTVGSRVSSAYAASLILAGGAGALYLSQSSYWAVSADIGGERSGVVSGVMNMGGQIGAAVTASLTPWLAAAFGWSFAFFFAAMLAIVGGALWLLIEPGDAEAASR